jgi:pentatricopeptide repeat protein
MKEINLTPDSYTYSTMLNLYRKLKELPKVKEIWNEMEKIPGIQINVGILSGIARLSYYEVNSNNNTYELVSKNNTSFFLNSKF